jgi:hypothetical protein
MGSGHFQRREGKPGAIEQEMIQAFVKAYVILPGSNIVGTYDDLDARFEEHAAPLLMEMKGSWLAGLSRWQESPVIGYPLRLLSRRRRGHGSRPPTPTCTWDRETN